MADKKVSESVSNPASDGEVFWTVVAQRLEHMPDMHAVGGSIPPHSIFFGEGERAPQAWKGACF